tara:strand:- start:409 stop:615 length:207 start_codon:yes stop_codon:yes gene_type:complete
MADAPKSLDEQLQDQRESLESQIQQLETQLMRSKEAYLKILGAQEFSAVQKQQAEAASKENTTEAVDP